MEKQKLRSNFWKIYTLKAAKSFMLSIPIIVPFLQENGLSIREIFILESLFSAVVIVLEIPTGYFADILGRKTSMIVGLMIATLGWATYSISHGFYGFLSAEILLGIGLSFTSGADSALLYESLLGIGKSEEYKKKEGRNTAIGLIAEGSASILGGFMAIISLRSTYYSQAAITLFAIPLAFTLQEPIREKCEQRKEHIKNMLCLIKFSLYDDKKIQWIIIYSSIASGATLTMFWFSQPYFLKVGLPVFSFGIILAAFLFSCAVFSWRAHWLEKIMGRKISLALLITAPAVGYFLLSLVVHPLGILFIILFYFSRGINTPVVLDYINGLVTSDSRATIISIRNLVSRAFFAVIGPFAGWATDNISLEWALASCGGIFLLLGIIALFFLRKNEVF